MKTLRFRLRTILIVIALAALIMAGVATLLRRPARPYSSLFAGFDPVVLLASRPGYTVNGIGWWNGFNQVHGYAYKEWRGLVTVSNDPNAPKTIEKAIEDYVVKVSKGKWHTEGTLVGDPHESPHYKRLPTHALFMFNDREWHGDLHVWLFPDSSGSSFGYAIYLREERIR
jgi:hypothetical protein